MSFFTVGQETADELSVGGAKHGEYFFKVIEAEVKETKTGKPMLTLDLQLYNDKKEEVTSLRYVNFVVDAPDSIGTKQLNSLCTVCGVSELPSGNELVGKKGVVLAGYEPGYNDPTKKFLKPAFGGFSCWYSMDRLSAKEMHEEVKVPTAIEAAKIKLDEKPVKDGRNFMTIADFEASVVSQRPVVVPPAPPIAVGTTGDEPF